MSSPVSTSATLYRRYDYPQVHERERMTERESEKKRMRDREKERENMRERQSEKKTVSERESIPGADALGNTLN